MRYTVVIERGDRNFAVYAPDLPGCVAVGDTLEEATAEMEGAIEFHLEGMREDGLPIPSASSPRSELSLSDGSIVIEPLPESDGGGFLATVPDLPGCMSDGETRAEAARNVEDAIAAWLEEARGLDRAAPEPRPSLRTA